MMLMNTFFLCYNIYYYVIFFMNLCYKNVVFHKYFLLNLHIFEVFVTITSKFCNTIIIQNISIFLLFNDFEKSNNKKCKFNF